MASNDLKNRRRPISPAVARIKRELEQEESDNTEMM